MTIENSVDSGTPDLCIPTKVGWTWVELKIMKNQRIYLKKSQYASIHRETRQLYRHLHRWFIIADTIGRVELYDPTILIGWDKKATKTGIWFDIPAEYWPQSRLDDVLSKLGVYSK